MFLKLQKGQNLNAQARYTISTPDAFLWWKGFRRWVGPQCLKRRSAFCWFLESQQKRSNSFMYPEARWYHGLRWSVRWWQNRPDFFRKQQLRNILEAVVLSWMQQNLAPLHQSFSPHLNLLDYAFWRILKGKARAKPHNSLDSLKRDLVEVRNRSKCRNFSKPFGVSKILFFF